MVDTGADPIEGGLFKMYPSGDIVDYKEKCKRLPQRDPIANDCLGLSWDQIEKMQGGKLKRNG